MSTADVVLEMNVVCGVRDEDGVCEMCMCWMGALMYSQHQQRGCRLSQSHDYMCMIIYSNKIYSKCIVFIFIDH